MKENVPRKTSRMTDINPRKIHTSSQCSTHVKIVFTRNLPPDSKLEIFPLHASLEQYGTRLKNTPKNK